MIRGIKAGWAPNGTASVAALPASPSARWPARLKRLRAPVPPLPLQIVGEFGLRNKRELWRVQMVLSKLRARARDLLTLDEKDPK